jgi:DNA-binding transcriptional ArsR family regulator
LLALARIAALAGDPARLNMLLAMKYDNAVSAGELADIAGVARSTAREHLLKLINGGLVDERAVGRWRYYSLADGDIAEILDGFEALAAKMAGNRPAVPEADAGLLHTRCCGDHLSGKLGARIADCFISGGFVAQSDDGIELTQSGEALLESLDVRPDDLRCRPRRFLYLCPDWTRSSFHLGGAVGAALLRSFAGRDWMRLDRKARIARLTSLGRDGLRRALGLEIRANG